LKVIFCTPTITRPFPEYLDAMERSAPALDQVGIEHQIVFEVGSCYISWARATMLQKAMKTDADAFVFIDHDLSWQPEDLVALINHPGDVVAGTYRFKTDDNEEYMGTWETGDDQRPVLHEDGTIAARAVPAGFLKVTRKAVEKFRHAYPDLIFGPDNEYTDLFNHGAYKGLWWGEDFAFSRRWRDLGGEIFLIPNLNITHHLGDQKFPGNLHQFLLHQPGGSEHGNHDV
jgi:glycosyltransferase involved in cell wall biosynthesis